jgi:hypothetical protein
MSAFESTATPALDAHVGPDPPSPAESVTPPEIMTSGGVTPGSASGFLIPEGRDGHGFFGYSEEKSLKQVSHCSSSVFPCCPLWRL